MFESRSLDDLRPDVRRNAKKFVEICASRGLPVGIASTVRDQEKQTEYFKKGTGSSLVSFHGLGSGLAFDIFHKTKGYDDLDFFARCGEIGKAMGFEWGGDWKSFPDRPHLQWSEGGKYSSNDILDGRVPAEMPPFTGNISLGYRYYMSGDMHIVEIPARALRFKWWDKTKRTTKIANYFNASFFGNFKTASGEVFTLPAGHAAADISTSDFSGEVLKELSTHGTVDGGKIRMSRPLSPATAGMPVTTLTVTATGAKIGPVKALAPDVTYAVSGMPVIRAGKDVSWANDVLPEGWDASGVYAAWHGFIGVNGDTVMYFGFKTKTSNCIRSSEAYERLRSFGCSDVMMLDGGGSYVLDVGGENMAATAGSRQINTVGLF